MTYTGRMQTSSCSHLVISKFRSAMLHAFARSASAALHALHIVRVYRVFLYMSVVVAAPHVTFMQAAWCWVASELSEKREAMKKLALAFVLNATITAIVDAVRPDEAFIRLVRVDVRNCNFVEFFSGKLIGHRGSSKAAVLSRFAVNAAGGFFILPQIPQNL